MITLLMTKCGLSTAVSGMAGLWERLMDALVKKTRENAGRGASPTYGIIDSQGVKIAAASEECGIDEGKNKRAKTAYSHGHNGEFVGSRCPCA